MFDQLSAPFPPEKISWRVGSMKKDKTKGMALAYLDARDVMERLDEVCGPAGWQSDCFDAGDGRLAAKIGIWVEDGWVWKCDGAGAREPNPGLSEMDANKGDFSDAFKRAAVQWGIGRYLYDVPAPWVELDEYKRIKPDQQWKFDKALSKASGNQSVGTPKPKPEPKEPTKAEKLIAQRPKGKRFDSKADSETVLQTHLTAIALAGTQAELKLFGMENKREIDFLFDDHWADLMITVKQLMSQLPEGHMENAA